MQRYIDSLDVILNALKINYSTTSGRYFFPCPIHGSDNYNSVSIYTNSGIWRCFTRHCEREHGERLIDFVKATLSVNEDEANKFCENILSGNTDIRIDRKTTLEKPKIVFKQFEREKLLQYVNPNIPFYLRRGYSEEILEKYDLFICTERDNKFYGRIVVPVYDDDRQYVIGMLGRTLHSKCKRCDFFHPANISCPRNSYDYIRFTKWYNAKGFARNSTLFNYWFSKEFVKETKELILVESPGNCIKLSQAGLWNNVGIFGTELTRKQIDKIHSLNPERILLGLDNDQAGLEALKRISDKLSMYNCIPFIPPTNDFGDMSCQDIQSFYNSII